MSDKINCPSCGKTVVPVSAGGKNFCPECETEIVDVPEVNGRTEGAPISEPSDDKGHVIKDGMGMIEENRTKIGAVETFSDNSVTNNNHTTNTTNISNITNVADDTKKSVVCEISGKKVLVTSSVICPVCGRTVSEQYYDEEKLRCAVCEQKAVDDYENFYMEMISGARVIDKELRSVLDARSQALKLTRTQVKETELKLRSAHAGRQEKLSGIRQKDFDRTLRQLKDGKTDVSSCLEKVSAYAGLTDDPSVQCWYHLLYAMDSPEKYIEEVRNATDDNYWQTYWAFVAAMMQKNTTEAVLCVDSARSKYPDFINDITLSQAYLELFQYMQTKDETYISDAVNDLNCVMEVESLCLLEFKDKLCAILENRPLPSGTDVKTILLKESAQSRVECVPQSGHQPTFPAGESSKGYALNTAGGPLNPPVASFSQVKPEKSRKTSGIWVVVILLVAIAGAVMLSGGWFGTTSEDLPTKPEVVVAPVSEADPIIEETETIKKPEPVQVVEQTAVTAEEAAPDNKSTMAAEAVEKTDSAPVAQPSGFLEQGLEAYEGGNFKEAHDCFKKAALEGNPEACYRLALMLSTGKGTVGKNPLQSKVWMKKAAELGHEEAKKSH